MGRTSIEHEAFETPFLQEYPVIPVSKEQMDLYSRTNIITGIEAFDVGEIHNALLGFDDGQRVWGADQGASSLKAVLYTLDKGFLYPTPGEVLQVASNGTGNEYLDFYRNLGRVAGEENIPVGISTAGTVNGTQLLEIPNVDDFKLAFIQSSIGGDFAQVIPTLGAVNNDAQAALKFAILHAVKIGAIPEDAKGRVVSMEPGHVELLNLRKHPDQRIADLPCGFNGATHVCVENSVGGNAIQQRWKNITGEDIGADKVAGRYREGSPKQREWAGIIYLASVAGFAEGIAGMGIATGLLRGASSTGLILPINGGGFGGAAFVIDSDVPERQKGTTVAEHGGVNREPGYDERVLRTLQVSGFGANRNFYTEAVTKYPGAMGAAMAALVSRGKTNARG